MIAIAISAIATKITITVSSTDPMKPALDAEYPRSSRTVETPGLFVTFASSPWFGGVVGEDAAALYFHSYAFYLIVISLFLIVGVLVDLTAHGWNH